MPGRRNSAQTAKEAIRLYKEKLRPLIREADLYHISPRPDGVHWDAVEYWQPGTRQGVVYAFHGSEAGEGAHSFALAGLSQDKHYLLHFEDGSSADRDVSGSELMQSGLKVQPAGSSQLRTGLSYRNHHKEQVGVHRMEPKAHPQDFAGRVAVVTGAARGIGRAIAENLRGRGAHLILVDRDAAGMASLSAGLSAASSLPVDTIEVDLSSAREVEELLLKVARLTPKLDVLVNNAGIEKDLPLEEVTAQFFDQIMATNLRAPFLLSQGLVPFFSEAGGAIVNISSIHASYAFPHAIPYACSKAALLALTRNLALELAGRKIRVNAVLPGYIDTPCGSNGCARWAIPKRYRV